MTDNTSDIEKSALVLFSGGQDSTVCLAHALSKYAHVETIGFDYGQRHKVEMDCRPNVLAHIGDIDPIWAERLGEDTVLELPALQTLSDTALTRDVEIAMLENGLPNTFVPGRNLLFITYAAALAYRRGLDVLVGGMCETDFSGYPDCRSETLRVLGKAIGLGMEKTFELDTPLMWLNKAETWFLAEDLGGVPLIDLIVEETHTCYQGTREQKHEWGYGCGTCPACELRIKGFKEWRQKSPEHESA